MESVKVIIVKCKRRKYAKMLLSSVFLFIFLLSIKLTVASIVGPTATYVKNETRTTLTNTSINESHGGGYVYTYSFDAVEQNKRWKAYVGNVTGALTLDDANGYSVYDWALGTINGRVFATRNSSAVSWSTINCTGGFTGNVTNTTVIQREDAALQHSRKDNITATFTNRTHPAFSVGDLQIPANTCNTIHTFVNNTRQITTNYFPEVLLYDGTNDANGKLIYASIIENNLRGYNGNDPADNATYDFQMIVPEVGTDGWTSSTAYYFYVELV